MANRRGKNQSIVEVAKKAGVSVTTVSRVLNNSPHVRPETKQQVLAAITKSGYFHSAGRPGPKPGLPSRKKKVALVFFLDRYHANMDMPSGVVALQRGAAEGGAENDLLLHTHIVNAETGFPESLRKGGYRGFLLIGYQPSADAKDFLKTQPCCWVMNNPWVPTFGDHVMPDHHKAGAIAANYLIERGCRNPCAIRLGPKDLVQTIRETGFHYAVHQHGLKSMSVTAKKTYNTTSSSSFPEEIFMDEIIDLIKKKTPRPDGFFMDCDQSLAVLYPVMVREKLIIPGKTVLIGCNNQSQYLRGMNPYPASIEVHFHLIGRVGAAQLAWRIKNKDTAQRICSLIAPNLIFLS